MFDDLTSNYVVLLIVSLIISIPVHESMHGLAARWLGDDTADAEGRISLNPFRHVDIMFTIFLPAVMVLLHIPPIFAAKPVPFDPRNVRWGDYGAALVSIAGPVSNLLLAVVAGLILRFSGISPLDGAFGYFLFVFMTVNVSLFVFNMLPIPPLDGSRLLYAVAPEPVQRVMAAFEGMGLMLTLGIFVVLAPVIGPIISNLSSNIIYFLLR